MIHRQLTRIQRQALDLCISMQGRGEPITDKCFGIYWADMRNLNPKWIRHTGQAILIKLVEKGWIIIHKQDGWFKTYSVVRLPKDYIPIDA